MEATRSRPKTPRASVACTTCRCRKVRCDVSRRGHPCMNCELDHEECVVLPRSRRKRPEKSPAMPDVVDGTTPSMPVSSAGNDSATQEINTDTHAVDIPFQAYGFIKADFLARLPQDEICYLDSQCCFRLPVRGSWNRLIHAYFRHINPLLPVVDEANFWEQPLGDGPATMSLFVAQAILFAACPFADCQAIEGCGFANCREARAAFYRRAKLLYRLESERNPVSIIKGSLLLSLCSSPQIQNPVNSIWLGIAIQYARSMGAHYLSPQGSSPSFEWRRLKRLWWSCLLRDRLIALGYQRPLQIPEADLEADLAIITSEEISHDICWSKVHSLPIRRELLFVFRAFCRLCIPLTRMLKLIATPRCSADSLKEADDCARSLKSWLDFTNGHLEASDVELRGNDLITLHYHLVQIYFHAAYLNILNFKIVMLGSTQTERDEHKSSLLPTASAVQASVEATADSLYMLEQLGLVGLLPIAAVRCIVLPFVLHSMHIKLSPTTDVTDAPQKRTESFLQLIRSLQVRQNNVNTLENVIEQVLTFIQPRQPMADWKQLILSQPGSYLRVLKTLDLALSTGIFPSKSEAPLTMTGADSDGKENLSRPDADGEGQSGPVPVPEKVQFAPETEYNLLDDNDGVFESRWRVEEELFGIAENSSDVDSGHPILRDIFGLCRDRHAYVLDYF